MKDIRNDPTSLLYQNEFFDFLDETLDFATTIWGESGFDKDYLEDCCLERYRYREYWDPISVLHKVRLEKERRRNKK